MTLCNCCKHKACFFGMCGPFYCSERVRGSFVACNEWTDFTGFTPIEDLAYSRKEIITKWRDHVQKLFIGGCND